MDFFTASVQGASFKHSKLVLGAVSLANVPQLASDLLIHHPALQLSHVGTLSARFSVPVVGAIDENERQEHGFSSPIDG